MDPDLKLLVLDRLGDEYEGELKQRTDRVSKALSGFENRGALLELVETHYRWGLAAARVGVVKAAREQLTKAIELFESNGIPKRASKVREVMSRSQPGGSERLVFVPRVVFGT